MLYRSSRARERQRGIRESSLSYTCGSNPGCQTGSCCIFYPLTWSSPRRFVKNSSPLTYPALTTSIDIHLRNALIKPPSTFDQLNVAQFRERFGRPETVTITRADGKPTGAHVPTYAVQPLFLGKKAQDFTVEDAECLILSDYGESFTPGTEQKVGQDCRITLSKRAPEALFEPDRPISYPSDIWSLAIALWEIVGMKAIFSESETPEEILAQQIDVLGSSHFPSAWRRHLETSSTNERSLELPSLRKPLYERDKWPPLEEAFETFVQKYRRKREAAGVFAAEETQAFLDLMRGMLRFRPEERFTITQVLESEWITRWALPTCLS